MGLYVPPQKIALSKQIKKSLIACAVLLALGSESLLAAPGKVIDKNYLLNDPATGDYDAYRTAFGEGVHEFDAIDLGEFYPVSTWDQHAITVSSNIGEKAELKIIGKTYIDSFTDTPKIEDLDDPDDLPDGTYALSVGSLQGGTGSLTLSGDVEIYVIHDKNVASKYGANAIYAQNEGSEINIGNLNTTTIMWALAKKPDLISAKNGAIVSLNSTHNQLVGSFDTISDQLGTGGSIISGKFSGSESFWFGNDQSVPNISLKIDNFSFSTNSSDNKLNVLVSLVANALGKNIEIQKNNKDEIDELLSSTVTELINLGSLDGLLELAGSYKGLLEELLASPISSLLELPNSTVQDQLDLVFEDGAQWTYFGDIDEKISSIEKKVYLNEKEYVSVGANITATGTAKRISSITLNGGIINLFDKDIKETWKNLLHNGKSLLELWPELADVNHDYVRIGDLKGNGGIFRLDLDAEKKQNSDMVFIESSSDGGQHFIEPYNMELLESVSPTNTLTFALQKAPSGGGKFVSFAEKQNIYGQSLFDYELEIDSKDMDIQDAEQIREIHYASWEKDGWNFDPEEYEGGKEWFIKRIRMIESAASIGMRSAGYASYDLAVNMDRRDRRLQNAVFQNEEKDGLWARVQYGEAGAEHLYNADLTTVYVGYEKATSVDNRLGFSFAYTDGESDLNDLKGSGDLKRYEASVYDTLTFGSHYLDFVARFGQVDNEFDVTNQSGALTTSGSFDQKYAALSAEYGYNFKDEHNVFIEPQVQLQVAYLGDYNYRTERNMKVDADSDISVIGRIGLRTGKTFESSDYVGELYARADVLHQFTDGQDAQFSDLSDKVNVTWGNKDTWSTFGVGGYLNWKDNVSFQVDVERTAGGETIDTWLVSGRVNYLF